MNTKNLLKGEVIINTNNARSNMQLLNSQFKKATKSTALVSAEMSKYQKLLYILWVLLKKVKTQQNELSLVNKKINKSYIDLNSNVKSNNNNLKKSNNWLKQNRGALMGIGFAALFGGMALKRVFDSALKSVFKTYKETMSKTSEFNQMTNQLDGAWTFFKFTLVDALMQTGLFQTMIGFVIKLVTSIGKFTAQHPKIAGMVIPLLATAAVLSTIVMIMGQVGLAVLSFLLLSTTGFSVTLPAAVKGFATGFASVFKPLLNTVAGWFSSFFNVTSQWLTKLGLKTDFITANMMGKFTAFGLVGTLVGKLLYEGLFWGFEQIFTKVPSKMEVMILALSLMFSDWLSFVKKSFSGLGILIQGIFTADLGNIKEGLKSIAEANLEPYKIKKNYLSLAQEESQNMNDQIKDMALLGNQRDLINKKYKNGLITQQQYFANMRTIQSQILDSGYSDEAIKKAQTFYVDEEAHATKLASIMAAISSTAISGATGFYAGGGVGLAGMAAGAGIASGLSAFNDVQDLSESINPSLQLEEYKLNQENNSSFKAMKEYLEILANNSDPEITKQAYKEAVENSGLSQTQFNSVISSTTI